jgi:hypothetical protein
MKTNNSTTKRGRVMDSKSESMTMKRVTRNSNGSDKSEKADDPIYYNITSYPTGGGYGGTEYIRLEDKGSEEYGTPLNESKTIEVLWPNGEKSVHKITTTEDYDSFYCRDACQNFHTTTVWTHIVINHNGSELNKVKINEIKNIKARIVDTVMPEHPICW